MTNVTTSTQECVTGWIRAKRRVVDVKHQLSVAECELMNATNDLGRWLVPKDAKEGEQFHIWYGNGILAAQLQKGCSNDYAVCWRKEPEGKQAIEQGI